MAELADPQPAPPSARRAAFIFIFITLALDMLALGIIVPVLPKLIVEMRGGDEVSAAHWVGLFSTLWAVMQFLAMPIIGALSDKVGRRPIILLSNFGQGADYVLMALAPNLWWLLVGRLISGVTTASVSTGFAYVADVTPPEKRAGAFGALGAAFGLGFVIGPALGGVLGEMDPRLPFWLAGGLSMLNGLYGLFVLPESLAPGKRGGFSWGKANPIDAFALLRAQPRLLGLASVKFLNDVAHVVYPTTFALYFFHKFEWTERGVGLFLAAVGAASIVVQAGLVGRIVKAIGERRALLIGLFSGAAGFVIYALAPEGWVAFIGVVFAAFWGLAGPSGQALMSRRVGASEQGRLQGALSSLTGVAGLIGPTLFTGVFAYFISSAAPVQFAGAACLVAAACVALSLPIALVAAREEVREPVADGRAEHGGSPRSADPG
ncbi:TCR/Tet family MFS transporter [Terricaulis sp.]|uniref:TCR/Tet family MFS transporter n=1 Tax=Terricaulis sp. TaxID=2768686 RepID=UPI0037834C18